MNFFIAGFFVLGTAVLGYADVAANEFAYSLVDINNGDVAPSYCYTVFKSPGTCKKSITEKWFHNPQTKTCQTFSYDGCGSNGNVFATKDGCEIGCGISTKSTASRRHDAIRKSYAKRVAAQRLAAVTRTSNRRRMQRITMARQGAKLLRRRMMLEQDAKKAAERRRSSAKRGVVVEAPGEKWLNRMKDGLSPFEKDHRTGKLKASFEDDMVYNKWITQWENKGNILHKRILRELNYQKSTQAPVTFTDLLRRLDKDDQERDKIVEQRKKDEEKRRQSDKNKLQQLDNESKGIFVKPQAVIWLERMKAGHSPFPSSSDGGKEALPTPSERAIWNQWNDQWKQKRYLLRRRLDRELKYKRVYTEPITLVDLLKRLYLDDYEVAKIENAKARTLYQQKNLAKMKDLQARTVRRKDTEKNTPTL